MWKDFLSLIYPKICPGCNEVLLKNEKGICAFCIEELPKTHYSKDHANPVAKLFWGKLAVETALSIYTFSQKSKIQNLIHNLKYTGNIDIGVVLGVELGKELLKCSNFNKIDVIIPVPLHKKKERKRGYNQSYFIAKGVSQVLNIPINNKVLYKVNKTSSQTNKSRYDRWLNIKEHFKIDKKESLLLAGSRLLLIDDVITTGSTIEACGLALNEIKDIKLHIATIAKS